MTKEKIVFTIFGLLILISIIFIILSPAKKKIPTTEQETAFTEIQGISGFLNTNGQEIKIADYIGKKVILLDFVTYSCINCQRTFPYLNAWFDKYEKDGLIIIGIHTPEFAFEKDSKNVEKALAEFGIKFPVVLDNDYKTWQAYGNKYWPRKYLIDKNGNIVYDHIGEGNYTETELKIQELLADLNESNLQESNEIISEKLIETKNNSFSPETYFGANRNKFLGNGKQFSIGQQDFIFPDKIKENTLYLNGVWQIDSEFAQNISDNSTVKYQYSAEKVHLVMDSEEGAEIEIWQDGQLIKENSVVRIKDSRLYTVIDNLKSEEHLLEIKVKNGQVRFFAFTFG